MLSHVFVILCTGALSSAEYKVVSTRTGPVHGETVHSRDPRTDTPITYTTYKSVPFAKPPVGDLRFAYPQPLSEGEGGNMGNITYQRMCYQLGNLLGSLRKSYNYISIFQ